MQGECHFIKYKDVLAKNFRCWILSHFPPSLNQDMKTQINRKHYLPLKKSRESET